MPDGVAEALTVIADEHEERVAAVVSARLQPYDQAGDSVVDAPQPGAVARDPLREALAREAQHLGRARVVGQVRVGEHELQVEGFLWAEAVDEIEQTLFGKRVESKRESKAPPSGPRQFTSADGLLVIVGRTEAENDEVTFRMASGNDYWFHVQGMPGSHVIVKAPKGKSVPLETLLDAAALAKLYSRAKDADATDVDYTQRKYVRKRKDGGPGNVDYWEYKTLHVKQDAARLERLFGQG